MPRVKADLTAAVPAQVVDVIRALTIPHPDAPMGWVSVSVGRVTTIRNPKGTPTRLFAAADKAPYAAKHAGRNGFRASELRQGVESE